MNFTLLVVSFIIVPSSTLRCYLCEKPKTEDFMALECLADRSRWTIITCSDPNELCGYVVDRSGSIREHHRRCAIPKGNDQYWQIEQYVSIYSSPRHLSLWWSEWYSGGHAICWHDTGHNVRHLYTGDSSCFCDTDLCNYAVRQTNTELSVIIFFILVQRVHLQLYRKYKT